MIAEVGIMAGFYILARLGPASWRKARALASFVSAAIALVVIAHLTIRSVGHYDMAAMVDVFAWILLALVVAMVGSGDGYLGLLKTSVGVVLLVAFAFLGLKPAFAWL